MSVGLPVREGQILRGPLFSEPMRVETIRPGGPSVWIIGLAGVRTSQFRRVTLTDADIVALAVEDTGRTYKGDGRLLKLGLQAYALGIAYEYDPYFGLSVSRVDPLPHQLEAVYDYLLKLPRVRFLLADDAGAGKTIMAGLLIRELKLRGLIERVLVVCPANLAFQWQRELKEKFDEKFVVVKGGDIRDQFGVNPWSDQPQLITSLDLAKRTELLPGLRQVRWDLVIVDEAHRMSASDAEHKTQRYRLGELLRDCADHFVLLTATPHRGDPGNFTLFLQLLDADAYADVKSIHEAMERRRAPFYLRRTKEAMVYFPERQPDGTWAARKVFTKRIPHLTDFRIDGPEFALYRAVTDFVKRQSALAAARADDPRARAVGFLMALYQRRLASSAYAVRRSLEKRIDRLEAALRKGIDEGPIDLPTPEELEEMEEAERERLEERLASAAIARRADDIRAEIVELKGLVDQAKPVEGVEAKRERLQELLHQEGFFDKPEQRLLIFTEFKDTLDGLVADLKQWGFKVGSIHGGMQIGSRDMPGTRLWAEQQFREGGFQVLVATEAAGEGINLQCCNILFNYDIPWNPNRLEQRMGRIHRYGQTKDCLIFNFVATNTIEGRILEKLLDKLQEIRDALDDDAVFNVVGEVLPAAQIERVLRDYYAGRLGDIDLEEQLLRNVDEDRFRTICHNALEGLATKKLNLEMLVERRARAQQSRLVPEAVFRFTTDAAEHVPFTVKPVASLPFTFDPAPTPDRLVDMTKTSDWRLPALANRYPRCTTDRATADDHHLEWVTPGHPLFEAIRRHTLDRAGESFRDGACFYSLAQAEPTRLDFYRARIVDGLGDVVHERLFAVELAPDGAPRLIDPGVLGNLTSAPAPVPLPPVAELPEAADWLHDTALRPFLDAVRGERVAEIDRVAAHVEVSLTELILRADEQIGRAAEAVEHGEEGAEGRLRIAEDRHRELTRRRQSRREELARQANLTLQEVERIAGALVLPHPDREQPEILRLRPDPRVEQIAMDVAIAHEQAQGRQVTDVHEQNLGYDIMSVDLRTSELRLIEVKGIGATTGTVMLTPNEKRVAEDRRDCYWLYIVTKCNSEPRLEEPVYNPAALSWHEVTKVDHYYLSVNAMGTTTQFREGGPDWSTREGR